MTWQIRLMAFAVISVFSLMVTLAHAQSADNTPRTALVFGNAAYSAPDRPLKNPVSDARLMARTLKDLGFDVRLREDVDRRSMLQALRELEETLRKTKGVGFVYFAGHGVQVNGRNYIVPIGANLVRDVDAQKNAIDIDAVLQSLRDTGAKLNILVLDACRNNPLLATSRSTGAAGAKAGLAPMRPPEGALVAFATEPGRLASDGKDAGNGLYTRHLARWIKEPNLTIEQVFKRTREAVQTESKGEQVPTEYSVLTGADLYLVNPALAATTAAPAVPPVNAPTTTASANVLKNNPQQTSRSAVGTVPTANPTASPNALLSNAVNTALDAISSGEGARRQKEMEAPAKAMVAMIDTAQARVKLGQVGGSFTKQSLQQAIDNDDVVVFDLLIASGWKLETWDVVRIIDPRENRWDWPVKIMKSIALHGKAMPIYADVCDAKNLNDRFKGLADVLRRGFDSPVIEDTRILYHRDTFNKLVAERRKFYQQMCGATALASK